MANKTNATCSICGKPYHLCLSCKSSMSLSPWKIHTDTAEHYKVFQVIKGYSTNVYTKDEARKKFKNIDLSDLDTFRPHIKSIIEDIIKEEKIIIEPVVEIKPTVSNKRNYKKEKVDEKVEDVIVNGIVETE